MKRSIIAILLAVAMLTAFAACGNNDTPSNPLTILPPLGEGNTVLTLLVSSPDGDRTSQVIRNICTDKATLGEALDEAGLIGRDATGMVVTVDGVTLDWDKDHAYWAFYINGETAMHGVDDETITAGNIYGLEYTPG